MDAFQVFETLKLDGFHLETDGKFLEVAPADKLSQYLIEIIKTKKHDLIRIIKAEHRLNKVSQMLNNDLSIKRAVITDVESDAENVIMTIAIRDVAMFEVFILKSKFDGLAILQILEKLNYETTH